MAKILVVDDEIGIRELLSEILSDEGYDVALAENAAAARAARGGGRPDLVLLDIWMPDTDGVTLLKEWAAGGQLTMPVIMMSGHGTIDTAVEATRIGALDFLEKPIALQKLLSSVKRALQKTASQPRAELTLEAFAGSPRLRDLKRRIEQLAKRSRALVLRGGPGAIVELSARSLHRPGKSWLDLGSLGHSLDLDMLEAAGGGLLFAPDLAVLSRLQQKNIAFALDRLERYDLRLAAGTTGGVQDLVAQGWEESLARRLFEVWLSVPTLAELKEELAEMASAILSHLSKAGEVPQRRFSKGALAALRGFKWPGGYGELKAAIRSLALAAPDEEIDGDEVVRLLGMEPAAPLPLPLDLPLREAREAFERVYFEYHLRLEAGNMTRLAEKTGLERTHLYRKLKQLGVNTGRRGDE